MQPEVASAPLQYLIPHPADRLPAVLPHFLQDLPCPVRIVGDDRMNTCPEADTHLFRCIDRPHIDGDPVLPAVFHKVRGDQIGKRRES